MSLATMNRAELLERAAELRDDLKSIPEADVRSGEDSSKMRTISEAAEEVDTRLTLMDLEEREANGGYLASTAGGVRSAGDPGQRSIGDLLLTDELMAWVEERGPKGHDEKFFREFENSGTLDAMLTRAMSEWGSGGPPNADPNNAGALLPVGQPIAPVPRQARLFLRDLIPTMTTTLSRLPYVQELNPTAQEGATAIPEGGFKAEATMNFQPADASPTVLAATLRISKQLFEDAAAVVQYINTRLPYLVKFKEDAEFLNGSGTWPDMQGILGTSGVLTQSNSASDNAITLGSAFAKIENQDGTPTAVVLNPTNAWAMFTKRAAGGAGNFDAGTPFSALPLTVWGVPTYRTRAMTLNTALVGDFQLGAMIADREEVNTQTYRERYAEVNQILLICEERVGLMVFRPDLFCNTTLG